MIVGLHQSQLAVPCDRVWELLRIPTVTQLPASPEFVRGVINLRGDVMPMVDLRKRLRLPPYGMEAEAFVKMIDQRADEQKHWIAELELSLQENRRFTLETDPTQCAFGRWYSSFRSDKVMLASLLKSFESPHREIHGLAEKAEKCLSLGKPNEALAMVEHAKSTTLARLLQLFGRVEEVLRETQREMAIVLELAGARRVAVSVDDVHSVETIDVDQSSGSDEADALPEDALIGRTIRRQNTEGLVSLLEIEHLWNSTAREKVAA